MSMEVRNRKNKSPQKNQNNNSSKSDDEIIPEKKLDFDDTCGRDAGDGDSTPDTPPPEHALEEVPSFTLLEHKPSPCQWSFPIDMIAVALFALAFSTRLWRLDSPNGVVFDEMHYGKYAGLYMQNTFFFDSQPPLGKQLIALAAYAAGFDGNFKFDRIGTPYNASVPVVAMRMVPAFFGSLLMPSTYLLVVELGFSHYTGALAAFLLIFDNAMLAQSRFILLESIMMFFGVFGLLCILRLRRYYDRPYSLPWFTYLSLAAVSLSAAFCVRYFGIFTFLMGVSILAFDFWQMVADRFITDRQLLFHFLTRAFIFLSIPVALYVSVFYVHLNLLYKAGPNDNIMTSAFQASLEGGLAAIISNQPLAVIHGSQITLRHTHGRTCWLHSHDVTYPVKYADGRGSSHQQQVTCYSYKDVNNWWIVKKPDIEELAVSEPHIPIHNGDVVQLVHGLSSRMLNSHDVAAAMSPHNQEVGCYIDYNVSMPAQNLWRVEILNSEATQGAWHAVDSQLRLIHVNSSQALKFSGRQLPDWAFRQHEIVTDKDIEQEDTVWNVEEHRYTRNEDKKERDRELIRQEMIPVDRKNLTFWHKIYELQYKMLFTNQENVAGHMYASDPLDWLTLKRGVAYWISTESNAQVHFVGNIVVWLCGSAAMVGYLAFFTFYLLRRRRACFDLPVDMWQKFCQVGQILAVGYAVHYIPYFMVDRTLFLHHYLPAYIFKVSTLAVMVDHLHYLLSETFGLKKLAKLYLLFVFAWMVLVVRVFFIFAPVTYGNVDLTADEVTALTWRSSWDLIIHKK